MPGPTFGFVKLLASSRQAGFESRLFPDLPLPFIPTLIGLRAFDLVSSRVWWEAATNTGHPRLWLDSRCYIYVSVWTYTQNHTQTLTRTHTHTHTHIYIYIYIYEHTHKNIYARTHIYIHIYINAYTITYKHTHSQLTDPTNAWRILLNTTGLTQARISTSLSQVQISTDCFFQKISKIPSPSLQGMSFTSQ